jgi:hypothetical protein
MYPLFALLLLHGSSAILKSPILGWWLLVPITLLLTEKLHRIIRTFIPVQVTVMHAEKDMVGLSIHVGVHASSSYRPGQYIFLQIPSISRFQWHPFTVSTIAEDRITLHIRTSAGDWTRALYEQVARTNTRFTCSIDGPYGSPSREFYRYDKTIIMAAGVGMTPFSAILCDLSNKLQDNQSPWKKDVKAVKRYMKQEQGRRSDVCAEVHVEPKTPDRVYSVDTAQTLGQGPSSTYDSYSRRESSASSTVFSRHTNSGEVGHLKTILNKRSISLHWTVRSSEDLQWLSFLLNKLTPDLSVYMDVHLYVTKSNKDAKPSMTIFRSLLDHRRIDAIQQTSVLTGLLQTCHFSRPNFAEILDRQHAAHTLANGFPEKVEQRSKVTRLGIIFCGPMAISKILSKQCEIMTSRARADGSRLRYHYHSESF